MIQSTPPTKKGKKESNFLKTKFSYKIGFNLNLQTYSISFLLKVNFDKFTIGLHLLISSMLAKFIEN